MRPAEGQGLTDAERIEFLSTQLRHYKDLSIRLTQELQAHRMNTPEKHTDRGLHKDPVGNLVASRIDRQNKRRKAA